MAEWSLRRVVVWADGSSRATPWAARHALARAVPLHVLHFPKITASAGALPEARAGGFAASDPGAVDVLDAVRTAHLARAAHAHLTVTFQLVQDGRACPDRRLIGPGDMLVTGPVGYLDLTELRTSEPAGAESAARVPLVVVPDRRPTRMGDARRVLLMVGQRLSPAAAAFAFAAAADLSLPLDAVRVAPDDGAFGDDYWIDPMRSSLATEPRLLDQLTALHEKYPDVRTTFSTLRTEPWMTLRAMAETAQLAVLDDGAECAEDLRRLLGLGTCPVAVIPEN